MGRLNIPLSSIVYLDTSIFIYTVESYPQYWLSLQPLWLKFQQGEIEIITSELTLMEVLIFPLKTNDPILVENYRNFLLSTDIKLIPISLSILEESAKIRATTRIKTPDAIHLATAYHQKCTIFLTNDKALRNIAGLSVISC